MTIEEKLRDELKDAMKQRDQNRRDVIRAIGTEVKLVSCAKGFKGDVDDTLYLKVIGSYVKKMKKAKDEYDKIGEKGRAMAEKLGFEVEYLSQWLPKKLDEGETRKLVVDAIAELGVTDPKQMGRVMGHLMKNHRESLDGGIVNRIVREELAKGDAPSS